MQCLVLTEQKDEKAAQPVLGCMCMQAFKAPMQPKTCSKVRSAGSLEPARCRCAFFVNLANGTADTGL